MKKVQILKTREKTRDDQTQNKRIKADGGRIDKGNTQEKNNRNKE